MGTYYSSTPKNFTRKKFNCSCECTIICGNLIDKFQVKYKVKPNLYNKPIIKYNKAQWASYQHWGEIIKESIELPKLFLKLDKEDFLILDHYFKRDGIQMPFISKINILNEKKYLMLKNQENRKQKLINIKKL